MAAHQRSILAANWKMNHGPTAASAFLASFLARYARRDDRTVILFPSALAFAAAQSAVAERPDILLGVQNISTKEKGAFTGENSASIARFISRTRSKESLFSNSTPRFASASITTSVGIFPISAS